MDNLTLKNAYEECILGGGEHEYVFNGIAIEVADLETIRKFFPGVKASLSYKNSDGVCSIWIAKEDIVGAPHDMQLTLLNFIVHHELGHIKNNDKLEKDIEINTTQEIKADKHAIDSLGMTEEEAIASIDAIYSNIADRFKDSDKSVLEYQRIARINAIKEIKSCS